MKFCCLSRPVYDILLWPPKQTKNIDTYKRADISWWHICTKCKKSFPNKHLYLPPQTTPGSFLFSIPLKLSFPSKKNPNHVSESNSNVTRLSFSLQHVAHIRVQLCAAWFSCESSCHVTVSPYHQDSSPWHTHWPAGDNKYGEMISRVHCVQAFVGSIKGGRNGEGKRHKIRCPWFHTAY